MGRAARLKRERKEIERREIRRIAELDDRPLMVVTSLGNSILSQDASVYVRVSENQYVQKSVSDLKEGEQVIFEKEGINLQQHKRKIDELLMTGRKYRQAMASLFEGDETFQPKFRAELLRGITEVPDTWSTELRDPELIRKVIQNEMELPLSMAQLAAETIHAQLIAGLQGKEIHAVSQAHIQNGWLAGNVIAPRNFKDVFAALGGIAPGLLPLAVSAEFERDYHMYVAMRLSISLRLTNIMEGNGGVAKKPAGKSAFSYLDEEARKELDEIVEYFGDSISPKHKIASVVRVEPVKRTKEVEVAKNAERLHKGVVTKKPDDVEIEVLTPMDIMKMRGVIGAPAKLICDFYYAVKDPKIEIEGEPLARYSSLLSYSMVYLAAKLGYETQRDSSQRALRKMDEAGINRLDWGTGIENPILRAKLEGLADEVYRSLLSGELDGYLGLEQGSLLKIAKAYGRITAMEPRELVYAVELRHLRAHYQKLEKDISRIQREIELVDKVLARKGYHGSYHTAASFWGSALERDHTILGKLIANNILTTEDVTAIIMDAEDGCEKAFEKLAASNPTAFQSLRQTIIWKPERRELLRKLGLLEIMDKIEEERQNDLPHMPPGMRARLNAEFDETIDWKTGNK